MNWFSDFVGLLTRAMAYQSAACSMIRVIDIPCLLNERTLKHYVHNQKPFMVATLASVKKWRASRCAFARFWKKQPAQKSSRYLCSLEH